MLTSRVTGHGRRACAGVALAAAAASAVSLIVAGAADAAVHVRPVAGRAGTLQAWGSNRTGDLGNGMTGNSGIPVAVGLPPGTRITGVAAGVDHSLARTATGRVLAWGNNAAGELGDGSASNSSVPVQVRLPRTHAGKVIALAGGGVHSLALLSSGAMLAWGYNAQGQLGTGTGSVSVPAPVRLPAGVKITAISGGSNSSMALSSAGSVLTWGWNRYGQLGDDSTTDSGTPVFVMLPADLIATGIGAGPQAVHNFAIVQMRD